MVGQRYKLVKTVSAVCENGNGEKPILSRLEAGTIVTVHGYRDAKRMVEIIYEDQALVMFAEDLRARSVRVLP